VIALRLFVHPFSGRAPLRFFGFCSSPSSARQRVFVATQQRLSAFRAKALGRKKHPVPRVQHRQARLYSPAIAGSKPQAIWRSGTGPPRDQASDQRASIFPPVDITYSRRLPSWVVKRDGAPTLFISLSAPYLPRSARKNSECDRATVLGYIIAERTFDRGEVSG
jgi:hypothetical protein